ncbi:MAG: hypothetical protein WDW38_009486 [Sanguina aurantia]
MGGATGYCSPSLQMQSELQAAVQDLSGRGLVIASRWAAEQLIGLDCPNSGKRQPSLTQAGATDDTHPRVLLGRCYMENKEYQRAAHCLADAPPGIATFLRLYCQYLAGEKSRNEERIEKGGSLGRHVSTNPALPNLHLSLLALLFGGPSSGSSSGGTGGAHSSCSSAEEKQQRSSSSSVSGSSSSCSCCDPEGDMKREGEAREALVTAVTLYPCNWSAWQALQALCPNPASVANLALPAHWAREFFLAALCLDQQQNQEALSKLQTLSQLFRDSSAVLGLVAQAHYNLQNYDEAAALFEDLRRRDPYQLEGMDVYSNILFVKEQAATLSALAQSTASTDKYRQETCCVIGNFFSHKGQHDKALEYFRRALSLNPNYLAAWTLMGHEYMELKNTAAAVDAYRHAVELQPSDFRALYGLGQAYELLKLPYYALYYYRKAALLRPEDARMWCALAQCYSTEQVNQPESAIKCYQRAIEYNDPDGIAMHLLAKLYESRLELSNAEELYRYNLARLDAEGMLPQDGVEALIFLATRCKDTQRLEEAESLCQRLMDVGGPAKERAKALAREVRSLHLNNLAEAQRMAEAGMGRSGLELPLQQQQQQQQHQQLQQQRATGGAAVDVSSASAAAAAEMSPDMQALLRYQDGGNVGGMHTPGAAGPGRGHPMQQRSFPGFTPGLQQPLFASSAWNTPDSQHAISTAEDTMDIGTPFTHANTQPSPQRQQHTPQPFGLQQHDDPGHDHTVPDSAASDRSGYQRHALDPSGRSEDGGLRGDSMGFDGDFGSLQQWPHEESAEDDNVQAVMQQLAVTKEQAVAALLKSGGNAIAAIRAAWYIRDSLP